jgi:hypothetical protein
MAATVERAIRELIDSTLQTLEALLPLADTELAAPSDHVCAQGKDVWTLITNDIDHEKIHVGQILEGRYESRFTQTAMARLTAEWLVERARLIGALIGLDDEQFNSPTAVGEWTYRQIAKHACAVEQDSLRSIHEGLSTRA